MGSGNELTNLEVVKLIISKLGASEDLIEFTEDRVCHDLRYAMNSTKLKNLGWKPEMPFEEGIERTISWYLENKPWWERKISNLQKN